MGTLAKNSIHAWIAENGIVNEMGRPIEFDSHFFLFDPMCDRNRRIKVKKCTQIGFSTMGILRSGHAAREVGHNVIYSLPTDNDVSKFVTQKVDPMIANNPSAFGKLTKNDVTQKGIGDRFITFQGTVSKTAMLMLTADWLYQDEIDRSDLSVLEKMETRVGGADSFGGIVKFSNPSTPGIGIDREYEDSDRRVWHVTCPHCRKPQELTYEDNVDEARGIYACSTCQKEIPDWARASGEWIATNPEHPESGYHISQLMAPWVSAERVIRDRKTKEPDYFYNFTLGLAYADSDSVVDKSLILDNWTPDFKVKGDVYMGLDVGKVKHYVIGTKDGVFRIGRFSDWSDFDELLKTYRVQVCVMDALPETTMSDAYRNSYPGVVWTCYYNKDRAKGEIARWGDKDDYGIVWADRSRLIGRTVMDFQRGEVLVGMRANEELRVFLDHICSIRKLREPQQRLLTKVESTLNVKPVDQYVWTTVSANDHFAHALGYWNLARTSASTPEFATDRRDGRADYFETASDGQMANVLEAMEEDGYLMDD